MRSAPWRFNATPGDLVASRQPDPAELRGAVAPVMNWLRDENSPAPQRPELAAAVRLTARALAAAAPGSSVEVRIPPFVAVQCMAGVRHTRGTPPNVVETDPRTWLLLATGLRSVEHAIADGTLRLSGSRADGIAAWVPLVGLGQADDQEETAVRLPVFGSPPVQWESSPTAEQPRD